MKRYWPKRALFDYHPQSHRLGEFGLPGSNRPVYQPIQIHGCFIPGDLVTSYSINLLLMNGLHVQALESSLNTSLGAMPGKPQASFQVVKIYLCLKSMHNI